MKNVLIIIGLLAYSATGIAGDGPFAEKHITQYPFVATQERHKAIIDNYQRITPGMTVAEVEAILGAPDEVRPLYEPKIETGKQIGHTFWYVLQRSKESGSVEEKGESVVRIAFQLDGTVTAVDRW